MAGLEGGVDGIDLSVRPMASGTVQPDVRSMWHALKGTGFALDVDIARVDELERLLVDGLQEYDFDPTTTTADARVIGFPMPGGAIGPNVHMMKEAGILHRYGDVLREFPVVVKAGGAWTSVTPGSQQYWLQAFYNVLHGRWTKIEPGYGRAVLGNFGRPPLPPDPEVVKGASEQLKLAPFDGDPLEAAPDSLAQAERALRDRGLAVTEEHVFLVAAAIVPGKDIELNEGIRLLTGKAKLSLPIKKATAPAAPAAAPPAPSPGPASAAAPVPPPVLTSPVTTTCTVVEGGTTRRFRITIEPPAAAAVVPPAGKAVAAVLAPETAHSTPVFSPFEGKTDLVEIRVRPGDLVQEGQVVAAVEAMKGKHDVRAPRAGRVVSVDAELGASVTAGQPILTIGG